jgi:deoxyadenosine/deoxycytidine kinase
MDEYELMFQKAVLDLQGRYKPGAFEYLRAKYPDFDERLGKRHDALRDAWKQPDKEKFREALTVWYLPLKKAFDEYAQIG